MTKSDLVAGFRQWAALNGVADGLLFVWYLALAATALIAGAPWWLAVVLLVAPVVGTVGSIWGRARSNRESREFYLWLTEQWANAPVEQQPETD